MSASASPVHEIVPRPDSPERLNPALAVEALSVIYRNGIAGLRDASFTLPPGSITALVGINGAGKSTLFKALMGLVPIQSGRISILGQSVRVALKANRVAYVPQAER